MNASRNSCRLLQPLLQDREIVTGSSKGIAALIEGMDVDEAISRIKGIKCGMKMTSCPDQLARALEYSKNA